MSAKKRLELKEVLTDSEHLKLHEGKRYVILKTVVNSYIDDFTLLKNTETFMVSCLDRRIQVSKKTIVLTCVLFT